MPRQQLVWTKVKSTKDDQKVLEEVSDDYGLDVEEDDQLVQIDGSASKKRGKSYYHLTPFPEEALTMEVWRIKLENVLNALIQKNSITMTSTVVI
jgi:hypothetical protein